MKAIKFAEPWKVDCVDQAMPEPKEGEALIKIHCAAVCGSDIGAFRGTNGLVSYPRVIGHELSGEIVSIPSDPAQNPKGLKVGDRVAVDPYIYCGHCYACSIGRTNCCTSLKVLGVHVDGGMCEYFCHPANLLVKLPEGMSYEMGSLAEPLTIALHGIHRGGLKAGEYVAILGAGPIGLYAGMAAEAYGAHAIIIDIVQERLDFAKQMGVEYVSLESLYAQSDVITLHTFLNDSTYHMINTEAIQQMKPGVVIINCARGALIDTRALIDGIESGRVGSVGVDCFEGEDNVIRVDHNYNSRVTNHDYIILKSFQNTIVTPHVAFFTDQAVFDMVQCSLESLHQFELGEKVPLEVHAA